MKRKSNIYIFAGKALLGDAEEFELFCYVAQNPQEPFQDALRKMEAKYPGHTYAFTDLKTVDSGTTRAIKDRC